MLKHLQQAAPPVSAERTDLPTRVSKVVARAMEKRPEDRYNSVAELVEDFTIAAGMEPASVSNSASHNRVVVPTTPAAANDLDEETLVRQRLTTPMVPVKTPVDAVAPRSASPLSSLIPGRF